MVADRTGLDIANASLLDEATAAAENLNSRRDLFRGRILIGAMAVAIPA